MTGFVFFLGSAVVFHQYFLHFGARQEVLMPVMPPICSSALGSASDATPSLVALDKCSSSLGTWLPHDLPPAAPPA